MTLLGRWLALLLLGWICNVLVVFPAYGEDNEAASSSATIRISFTTVALGVGYSWGRGLLTLANRTYKFSIENVKVGSVGVSGGQARGTVRHLTTANITDFNGTYMAGEAGLVIGGGASGVTMMNENGVIITVRSFESGINFTLGIGGVTLRLIN